MVLVYRKKVCISIDIEKYKKLQELSARTRIPISRLTDEAIDMLLRKYKPCD